MHFAYKLSVFVVHVVKQGRYRTETLLAYIYMYMFVFIHIAWSIQALAETIFFLKLHNM